MNDEHTKQQHIGSLNRKMDELAKALQRGVGSMDTRKAMLVYQGGIANVFEVSDFEIDPTRRTRTIRVMQHAFTPCATFCKGLIYAGFEVRTAACNLVGDIREQLWSWDLDAHPFSDQFIVFGPRVHCDDPNDDPDYKVGGTD